MEFFICCRGLAGPSESSSSEEEWSYEEEDMPQHSEERYRAEFGVGGMAANPAEPIPLGDETSRLAVVDLDWSRLRAVDIMAVLRSFLPKAGRITRVTVYPSDFGMQRMKEEAVLGPQVCVANPVWPWTQARRSEEAMSRQ